MDDPEYSRTQSFNKLNKNNSDITVKTATTGMEISTANMPTLDNCSKHSNKPIITPKMSAILINNNEFLTNRSNKPQESNRLVFDFEGQSDRTKNTSNKHRLTRKIRENEDFDSDSEDINDNTFTNIDNFFKKGNDSLNDSFGSFNDINKA